MIPPRSARLATSRLILRPTIPKDFDRAFAIRGNWNVARNLSRAAFPPDGPKMAAWFDGHATEWQAGTAYRFAIVAADRMIGVIDIGEIEDSVGELGYWLDEADWGRGFGLEAAAAVVGFAFEAAALDAIRAGHAADNLASGRILTRLGFVPAGETTVYSRSRGAEIVSKRYLLHRSDRPAAQC